MERRQQPPSQCRRDYTRRCSKVGGGHGRGAVRPSKPREHPAEAGDQTSPLPLPCHPGPGRQPRLPAVTAAVSRPVSALVSTPLHATTPAYGLCSNSAHDCGLGASQGFFTLRFSFTLCVPGLGPGLATHLASVAVGTASLAVACPTTMLLAHGNVHSPRAGACFSSLLRIDFPPSSKSQSQMGWLPHLLPFKEPLKKPHLRVGPRGGLFWSLPFGTDG